MMILTTMMPQGEEVAAEVVAAEAVAVAEVVLTVPAEVSSRLKIARVWTSLSTSVRSIT